MSLSSSGNLESGYAPFAVLQQGVLTKVANTPLVIPCPQILATDIVLITAVSKSAGAGTSLPVEYITIQTGVSFTSTSYAVDFAGVFTYVVVRSRAKVIPS
jgi:hypothetical protein